MFTAILPALLLTAPGADPALEPWASKAQPGDVTRRHVEKIGTAEHKYIVVHGGTMDGTNCRSPMGCGMTRDQEFEGIVVPAAQVHAAFMAALKFGYATSVSAEEYLAGKT